MQNWFESVHDPTTNVEPLRRRRYGVIEVRDGRLIGIHLRPWPKYISLPAISFFGHGYHRQRPGNRCWLYYNQPRRHSNYLILKYIVSARDTTIGTARGALTVLDEIARIKHSDALLTDASNARISDRLLARWGWEPHLASRWHRHRIKRFYGDYPAASGLAARLLSQDGSQPPQDPRIRPDSRCRGETGLVTQPQALYDPAASAGSPSAQGLS